MYQERINEYFQNRESELVSYLSRLIGINSVKSDPLPGMPYGQGPADALALALSIAAEMGFTTANVDNYVGTVDLNERETRLGILCHLDVVGEGTGWSTPPFTAVVKDGMVYGRGSADNKGPAVAALLALKAVRDLGIPLKYNVRLILGTDEESGSSDIRYYFERYPVPPYTFSPDGTFPVVNTEKGGIKGTFTKSWQPSAALPRITAVTGGYRVNVIPPQAEAVVEGLSVADLRPFCDTTEQATGARFTLVEEENGVRILAAGKGGHASAPEHGVNAITALISLLASLPLADSDSSRAVKDLNRLFPHGDYYAEAAGIAQEDEISGKTTLSFDIYEQTPTGCKGIFDSRTALCATKENSEDIIRAKLNEIGFEMDGHLHPAHHTPCDSVFVKTLLSVYEQYTGLDGGCTSTGGGTYVHSIEGGVCFGAMMPDFEPGMHSADEHVRIADLITAARIFTQVIIELCQ